jgi:hypothetical protein
LLAARSKREKGRTNVKVKLIVTSQTYRTSYDAHESLEDQKLHQKSM